MKVKKYYSKDVTRNIEDILSGVEEENISLDIPIQRRFIWTLDQMCLFIHSLIIGFIPYMLFAVTVNDIDYIIDGKQRLSTILKFCNNEFCFPATSDLSVEYTYGKAKEKKEIYLRNMYFKDLPEKLKRNIRHNLVIYITYNRLSEDDICNLFKRINNGTGFGAIDETRLLSYINNPEMLEALTNLCDENEEFFKTFMSEKSLMSSEDIIQIIRAIIMLKENYDTDIDMRIINREIVNITVDDINDISVLIKRLRVANKFNHNSIAKNFSYILALSLEIKDKNIEAYCTDINKYFSNDNKEKITDTFNKFKSWTNKGKVVLHRYNILKNEYLKYII